MNKKLGPSLLAAVMLSSLAVNAQDSAKPTSGNGTAKSAVAITATTPPSELARLAVEAHGGAKLRAVQK